MDEQVQQAQSEIASASPAAAAEPPKSLDEVIAGLKGFGVKEFEEILTIKCGGKEVRIRISNIPTTDEMMAVMAADTLKGYLWIKRVKVEILSRAITWVNGVSLRDLPPEKRLVADPTDKGVQRDVQAVLRNIILGWGQEITEILWKVLMTHSQRIEEELGKQFPDNAVMTETERRLFEQARKEIGEAEKVIAMEAVAKLYDADIDGPLPEPEPEAKE